MMITTADAKKIAVAHLCRSRTEAVILAHGFYNNKDTYLFKEIAKMLHKHYDVFSFDFRGHGASPGWFSWTARETQDLQAVIDHAIQSGYKKIGLIGFSLGAAVTLIEMSLNRPAQVKSLISVSAPYDFWKIDFRFWEPEMLNDFKLNVGPKGRGKGVRPGNPFLPKIRPIDAAAKIAEIPVLFIHGQKDWLIKPHHSEKLFEAVRGPKELAIIKGAGHAEKIFDTCPDEFDRICHNWFQRTLQA